MKADVIIEQEMQKVKLFLDWKAGKIGKNLTADDAENGAQTYRRGITKGKL